MKMRVGAIIAVVITVSCSQLIAKAQDLGPGFTKVKDGVYVFAPDATTTTCSFVVTEDGELRTNGGFLISEHFPFVLRSSKHSERFSATC